METNEGTNKATKFGKYEAVLLLALSMTGFTAALISSLQAPFFPAEAEKKGLTASEYGITFAIYGLALFFCSPILGSMVQQIGGRFMLYIGTLITTSSTIMFGFLPYIPSHIGFLVMSCVLRTLEAIGGSAVLVSLFSFAGICFPGRVSQCYGIVQAMYVSGLSVGPTIGAIFYNIGGFTLPFVVVGVMNLFTGGFSFAILPPSKFQGKCTLEALRKSLNSFGSFVLLRIPAILLFTVCVATTSITGTFINATLEPDLRQFRLSVFQVGFVFLVQPTLQSISSVVWGAISDRVPSPELIMLAGGFINFSATLFVGPSSFLPFQPSLTVMVMSLGLLGVGQGAVRTPSYALSLTAAKNNGYPEDESTSSLISGLSISAFASGIFIGPLISGILFDQVGFRQSTIFITLLNFAMVITYKTPPYVPPEIHFLRCVALVLFTCTVTGSKTKGNNKANDGGVDAGHETDPLLREK